MTIEDEFTTLLLAIPDEHQPWAVPLHRHHHHATSALKADQRAWQYVATAARWIILPSTLLVIISIALEIVKVLRG